MRTITENLAQNLEVDKYQLDDECVFQLSLYGYYSEPYVQAKAERDRLKNKVELIEAEVEISVRESPPPSMKITEAVISCVVTMNAEVQAAKEEYRIACEKLYNLEQVMAALDQRNSQLGNLVSLYTKSYYTKMSGGEDFREEQRNKLNGGRE